MVIVQWLVGLVLALVLLAIARSRFRRVTIHDFERGVLFSRGQLKQVLPTGVYWLFRPWHSVHVVDLRSRIVTVPGQEILSSDNITVKITLAMRFHVKEPQLSVQAAQSFQDALYMEAQLILRDLVSAVPIEELLQKRPQLADELTVRLLPKAAELGVELETVGIKDIMFPGALKQVFAQVVEARKAAQAALEKARGETATLRHLANAAKLLVGNPALVTLKTLQAASDGKHTLVLGVPQMVIPIAPQSELAEGRRESSLEAGKGGPAADE